MTSFIAFAPCEPPMTKIVFFPGSSLNSLYRSDLFVLVISRKLFLIGFPVTRDSEDLWTSSVSKPRVSAEAPFAQNLFASPSLLSRL